MILGRDVIAKTGKGEEEKRSKFQISGKLHDLMDLFLETITISVKHVNQSVILHKITLSGNFR